MHHQAGLRPDRNEPGDAPQSRGLDHLHHFTAAGDTQATARIELQQAGLRVEQRQVPVRDPRQDNRVILQVPQAGSTVARGSTVTIVVGVGAGDG